MGISIIIPDVSFRDSNLGQVTIADSNTKAIEIATSTLNEDNITRLSVNYYPIYASDKGVTWSLLEGSDYASITGNEGSLIVKENANNSKIKVRATLNANNNIFADKEYTVTFNQNGYYGLDYLVIPSGAYTWVPITLNDINDVIYGSVMRTGTFKQYAEYFLTWPYAQSTRRWRLIDGTSANGVIIDAATSDEIELVGVNLSRQRTNFTLAYPTTTVGNKSYTFKSSQLGTLDSTGPLLIGRAVGRYYITRIIHAGEIHILRPVKKNGNVGFLDDYDMTFYTSVTETPFTES